MNSYHYPSPPHAGRSATEEAVAFVAALSRQRSASVELATPDAKRSRTQDQPVQRWLESVATSPLDGPHPHATTASTSFSSSLQDLEYSQVWSSFIAPNAQYSPNAFAESQPNSIVNCSTESLDFLLQRLDGVQTNFHPTPRATPQPQPYTSHAEVAGRPVNLRSTTAPVTASRSLAEIRAAAASRVGSQFGVEIDLRTKLGEPQLQHPQAIARSQTDPGLKVGGEPLSKDRFVAGLLGASVLAIESIWGPAPIDPSVTINESSVLPLHWFVKEVLRRSRTSCSTLQLALYYLHKSRREIREIVARADGTKEEYARLEKQLAHERNAHTLGDSYPSPPLSPVSDLKTSSLDRQARFNALVEAQNSPVLCGRRMFLASLIAASKFLQDRNYSNRAWARISGLPVNEINVNERAFLNMMQFQLHLGAQDFQKWTERLAALTVQGSAVESASAAAHTRVGLGLSRSQTDYPVEQPTEGLLRTARPPIHPVGRSHSDAEVPSITIAAETAASRQALLARSDERRTAGAKINFGLPQQQASPISDTSSSASDDESTSSTSSSSTGRQVRGLPIRRNKPARPSPRGIPLVRSGSQQSSMGSSRAWGAMEVDLSSAAGVGAQGWSRWAGAATGVTAH